MFVPDRIIVDQLAAALVAAEYDPRTVKQWRYRGIPWRERAKVAKIASLKKVKLPADFLTERTAA